MQIFKLFHIQYFIITKKLWRAECIFFIRRGSLQLAGCYCKDISATSRCKCLPYVRTIFNNATWCSMHLEASPGLFPFRWWDAGWAAYLIDQYQEYIFFLSSTGPMFMISREELLANCPHSRHSLWPDLVSWYKFVCTGSFLCKLHERTTECSSEELLMRALR